MALAQRLLILHLQKYKYLDENGVKAYFSTSAEMNLYLNKSLTELENDGTRPFDRNKFIFRDIPRILLKGFSNRHPVIPNRDLIDISQNIDIMSVKKYNEIYPFNG